MMLAGNCRIETYLTNPLWLPLLPYGVSLPKLRPGNQSVARSLKRTLPADWRG